MIYSVFIVKAAVQRLYSEINLNNKTNSKETILIKKIDEHYLDDKKDPGLNIYEVVLDCTDEQAAILQKLIFKRGIHKRSIYGFKKRPETYKPTTYWERIRNKVPSVLNKRSDY